MLFAEGRLTPQEVWSGRAAWRLSAGGAATGVCQIGLNSSLSLFCKAGVIHSGAPCCSSSRLTPRPGERADAGSEGRMRHAACSRKR